MVFQVARDPGATVRARLRSRTAPIAPQSHPSSSAALSAASSGATSHSIRKAARKRRVATRQPDGSLDVAGNGLVVSAVIDEAEGLSPPLPPDQRDRTAIGRQRVHVQADGSHRCYTFGLRLARLDRGWSDDAARDGVQVAAGRRSVRAAGSPRHLARSSAWILLIGSPPGVGSL